MRLLSLALALSLGTVAAAPLSAQTETAAATPLREGMTLSTADGRRVGRIVRIASGSNGATASVILDSRFVLVPVATITAQGRTAVTTMTWAQLRAM